MGILSRDETKVEWAGAEALRPFLVAVDELEPFPGNPKHGDVEEIRASLRRFGQVRPVLADGGRVVAGHHVVEAAREEGWSHVAVIPNEFRDEDEQRAYLLADNRLADKGSYDDELLAAQLRALAETDLLEGTGYTHSDVDAALARLASRGDPVIGGGGGKREHRDPGVKELVLLYSSEHLAQLEVWLGIVAGAKGTAGTSETVYEALRVAAAHLNA